jgi:GntR family transcriptional repressor for pyruvate dehydrogenase complex
LSQKGIKEHQAIYDAILKQDVKLAKQKMKEHFSVLYQYCYNI